MKKILIFSYFSGFQGSCQSEWIEDKLYYFKDLNYQVSLITGPFAKELPYSFLSYIKVPSLSFHDYKYEKELSKLAQSSLTLSYYMFFPIALIFGSIFDLYQYKKTKGFGEGRWSWFATALLAGFFNIVFSKPEKIFTTGGPPSAHLAGIALGKLFNIPVICELQDPLSGKDIGRNQFSAHYLFKIEKIIVKYATKVVYVTELAAKEAREKFHTQNIFSCYPTAREFEVKGTHVEFKKIESKINLIHLGSLYSTRNFDTLIEAINLLNLEKNDSNFFNQHFHIFNQGFAPAIILDKIKVLNFVTVLAPVSREQALFNASQCDILLLIQNNDDRSLVTIPFKTYDYLNLNKPILGLVNNPELNTLLAENGHYACHVNEPEKIKNKLLSIFENKTNHSFKKPFSAQEQLANLLKI